MKKKWLVQVKVVQVHGYILEAESAEAAAKEAENIEWSDQTCEDWLAVEPHGEPVLVSERA